MSDISWLKHVCISVVDVGLYWEIALAMNALSEKLPAGHDATIVRSAVHVLRRRFSVGLRSGSKFTVGCNAVGFGRYSYAIVVSYRSLSFTAGASFFIVVAMGGLPLAGGGGGAVFDGVGLPGGGFGGAPGGFAVAGVGDCGSAIVGSVAVVVDGSETFSAVAFSNQSRTESSNSAVLLGAAGAEGVAWGLGLGCVVEPEGCLPLSAFAALPCAILMSCCCGVGFAFAGFG